MRFDARALLDALEPPEFVDVDGTPYKGRHLSHVEHSRFLDTFQQWAEAAPTREEVDRVVLEMCAVCDLPGPKIVALPEVIYAEWLDRFFGYLAAPSGNGKTAASSTSASQS